MQCPSPRPPDPAGPTHSLSPPADSTSPNQVSEGPAAPPERLHTSEIRRGQSFPTSVKWDEVSPCDSQMLVWMATASRSGQAGGPCWPLSRGQASPTPPPLVLGTAWCPHPPRFLGEQEGEPGLTPTGGSASLRVPWSGHRDGEQALFCWLACLLKKARPGELSTHVQGSPSP